ncbi:hypothetical protein [Candidatus Similichlamydia laticola]|uniref:hypothetical protein n=1 Tax=Candidatus Similichlamydia laticola TaxID=2170265 RepID=UPI0011C08347|nr:hypothetical protein [Candidatus Similichlamydia laticola]
MSSSPNRETIKNRSILERVKLAGIDFLKRTYTCKLIEKVIAFKRWKSRHENVAHKLSIRDIVHIGGRAAQIPQYRIAYLAFQSICEILSTLASFINTLAVVIRVLLPHTADTATFISKEIMHPIIAFISVKNLLIYCPSMIFCIKKWIQLKRLEKEWTLGMDSPETLQKLKKILIKTNPKVLRGKSQEELANLVQSDRAFVLAILNRELKFKLTELTLDILTSFAGLLQVVFLTTAPPVSVLMTILYWFFFIMRYIVRPIANKFLSEIQPTQ